MNKKQKQRFILKEFSRFLKENEIFDEFISNANTTKAHTFRGDGRDCVNFIAHSISHCPQDIINDAFDWRQTARKSSVWCNLHCEWDKRMDEIMNKINKF